MRRAIFCAAIVLPLTWPAAPNAKNNNIEIENVSHLSAFCDEVGAFGYGFGNPTKAIKESPASTRHVKRWIIEPSSDWYPFDYFEAQISERSKSVFRVYGRATLKTPMHARSFKMAMAAGMRAKGIRVSEDAEAFSFSSPDHDYDSGYQGLAYVEGRNFTIGCHSQSILESLMPEFRATSRGQ